MKDQPCIFIADDHVLFAESLQLLLNQNGFTEVSTHVNGRHLLIAIDERQPELLILDVNMPVLNGLGVLEQLKKRQLRIPILILSTYGENYLIETSKAFGAQGYMQKNFTSQEFLNCVERVLAGKTCFPDSRNFQPEPHFEADHYVKQFQLTRREREIIDLLKTHLTNQEISQRLFLSVYTIETHRKNIMHKLGLKSPAALMRFIIEHQL